MAIGNMNQGQRWRDGRRKINVRPQFSSALSGVATSGAAGEATVDAEGQSATHLARIADVVFP